ncbi:MAG TPA: hypothetical protein VKA21_16585 [Candidatus Binatia bacterium]|nr:hypothetical protein [Candidatus Binatia bacterium]
MRSVLGVLFAGAVVFGASQAAFAKCGDNPGDDAAVLAARQQVASDCNCATAPNHGAYVKCAANVANTRASAEPSLLPKNCKGAVKKCAAKSVCGKPGFVTCCVTKNAVTKCKLKKDATKCTDAGGVVSGTASTGCSSCCDACPNPGTGPSCASPSGAFLD